MAEVETVGGPPRIPGFRYESTLGSGGFADVYRYTQEPLRRSVAVKVLHGLDPEARMQLLAEAHIMARLSSHPAIVPIYQVGESEDGRPYIVMQLCPPPHLSDRIRGGAMKVTSVLQAGIQLAGAVETAHRFGILHRDIKPANILYSEYGRPLLADFGIAHSTENGEMVRAFTPGFAPPEQLHGEATAHSDVYALSATLWAALTGTAPGGPAEPGVTRVSTGRDDVPLLLEDAVYRGLARDPAERYASALGLGRALQQVQHQMGLPVTAIELWDEDGRSTLSQPPTAEADARTELLPLHSAPTMAGSTAISAPPAAQVAPGGTPAQVMPGDPRQPAPIDAPANVSSERRSGNRWPALAMLGSALGVGVLALLGLAMPLPGMVDSRDPHPSPTATNTVTAPPATPQPEPSAPVAPAPRDTAGQQPTGAPAPAPNGPSSVSDIGGGGWGQ